MTQHAERQPCPALMAAWAAGKIDQRKVDVVAEALRDVEPVFADALAGSAVEYAGTHTAPQVRVNGSRVAWWLPIQPPPRSVGHAPPPNVG